MGSMLVTVVASGACVDLAVPEDAAVGELVPALVRRCEPQPRPWSRWALVPLGGQPIAPRTTLAAASVVDGAELELRDMAAAAGATPAEGRRSIDAPEGEEPERRRRRLIGLTERLVHDIGLIRAGSNPLLGYAAPEARRRLRALAPGRFDRTTLSTVSDLSLEVHWHRDQRAPVEAVAAFSEVGAGHPLDIGLRPLPAARVARRITVRLTADAACRYLLDLSLAMDPLGVS